MYRRVANSPVGRPVDKGARVRGTSTRRQMTQPVAPMDGSVSQSGLERTGAGVLVRRQRCQIATRQQPEGRGRRQARARVHVGGPKPGVGYWEMMSRGKRRRGRTDEGRNKDDERRIADQGRKRARGSVGSSQKLVRQQGGANRRTSRGSKACLAGQWQPRSGQGRPSSMSSQHHQAGTVTKTRG